MVECAICGTISESWITRNILTDELSDTWKLDKAQIEKINLRESSYCPICSNSARTRALGKAIVNELNFPDVKIFKEWIQEANKKDLKIAEINSCGKLHDFLANSKNLKYSEYHSQENTKINDIPNEDITNLSYEDNSFDLVIHSETLEHVPDYKKALDECIRILKPNGICIYTVPIINNRLTIKCVAIDEKGDINYLKPPSYHGCSDDYLVFWEFGDNFQELSHSELIYSEPEILNYVFAIRKKAKWNSLITKIKSVFKA